MLCEVGSYLCEPRRICRSIRSPGLRPVTTGTRRESREETSSPLFSLSSSCGRREMAARNIVTECCSGAMEKVTRI
jgi:hypothetical protein